MKCGCPRACPFCIGRSPHGERGLKCRPPSMSPIAIGRSPHGERGLKSLDALSATLYRCRSPHGERGLKFWRGVRCLDVMLSLPSRGAWIEMTWAPNGWITSWSLPSRGAWIEIVTWKAPVRPRTGRSPHGERGLKSWLEDPGRIYYQSLPSRGAWIEITR